MRKSLLITLLLFGFIIFIIGLRGIYIAYVHYDFFWTAKLMNPNKIVVSQNGKIYDDSWMYFIGFSTVSIVGYSLILVSDKYSTKGKYLLSQDLYPIVYIILVLIPIYFTFLDSKYSFSEKMMQLNMEKRAKSIKQ